jgi:hypothetical protein
MHDTMDVKFKEARNIAKMYITLIIKIGET